MRLYSIHPQYLDQKGLCGLWRESLLAQSVLLKGEFINCEGKQKIKTPYWNHPQLNRFKECISPLDAIGRYLLEVYAEAEIRGYNFDYNKIQGKLNPIKLSVTRGQLAFEFEHLQQKLLRRCWDKAHDNEVLFAEGIEKFGNIESHPLFIIVESPKIESWERNIYERF